jgi:hypothetical protein
MMHWIIPIVLASAPLEDVPDAPGNTSATETGQVLGDELGDCQRGVKGLKNDMTGLEFFLQDKKDYKNHCPTTKWEQPKLDEYKKEPKSYLPKECKPNMETLL